MALIRTANGAPDFRVQFDRRSTGHSFLEIDGWIRSEIKAISPLVDRLMRLIDGSHCVTGNESAVDLALWEAVDNAVVHGSGMDPRKLIHVHCRCELGEGVSLTVLD
jgi:hypothetical protein